MKNIFYILVSASLLFSCSKPYGEANFRCRIDGKEFVPGTKFIHAKYVPYASNTSTLYVSGRKLAKILPAGLDGKVTLFEELPMHADSVGRAMTFPVSKIFAYENDKSKKEYEADLTQPNQIIIDYYNPVKGGGVKGTFYLTAKEKGGSETLQITDGFFDVTFD